MTVRTRRLGADATKRIDGVALNREPAGKEPAVCTVRQSMIKREFGTRRDEMHLLRKKGIPAVRADDFFEQPSSVGCGFHHESAMEPNRVGKAGDQVVSSGGYVGLSRLLTLPATPRD